MAYKIDAKELYGEILDSCDLSCFKFKNSQINIKKELINDEIVFYDISSYLEDDVEIYNNLYTQDVFMLGFNITGCSSFYSKNINLNVAQNMTSIYFAKDLANTKAICQKGINKAIGIMINPKVVQNFLPKDKSEIFKLASTDSKTALYINEIVNRDFSDDLSRFLFQSKIFDILYSELSSVKSEEKRRGQIFLSEFDINALKKAKKILSTCDQIPTISELSKNIHLNEFKLKMGFKQLFKQTPCEFAREQKMLRAKELLQNSQMNIFEVSKALGFKHQGHFTKMFYDEFKTLPKYYKKQYAKILYTQTAK